MLKDNAPPGTSLGEGVQLRHISPPNAGGAEAETPEVPEAKPPKAFVWLIGDYF